MTGVQTCALPISSGVRPINNIVDITNYVMLEYGQPMHAFDYKYVKGGKIVVRNAQEGETLMTLDGVERALTADMLVICDEEKPSAVAGVMGGEYSGIMDDTDTIVFESACFLGSSVRITAKKLSMRTESSGRFEKGLDPAACMAAADRACELVELLGAGEVVGGWIDVDNSVKEPTRIPLSADWINRFLGIALPKAEMISILERLGFQVDGQDMVTVPSYRADVEHKADVAEEIARIYGYNKIPVTAIRGTAEGRLTAEQIFERNLSQIMLAQGCYEVSTYSFISPKYYDKINLPADSAYRNSIVITNPLGEDTSVMRTIAIPSMLEVLARNYNNRNLSMRAYEIATEYTPTQPEQLPVESKQLLIGMYGEGCDFFALKGIVEELFDKIGLTGWDVAADETNPTFHPGRCARLTVGETLIGYLGEIHPAVQENYGIGVRTYIASLSLEALFANRTAERFYKPLPKYPAVTRDLALLCGEDLPVLTMEKAIQKGCGQILEKVELFDVYRGQQVPQGKKSVAFNLIMRSAERTLTDEEIDRAIDKALKFLADLGAVLRS